MKSWLASVTVPLFALPSDLASEALAVLLEHSAGGEALVSRGSNCAIECLEFVGWCVPVLGESYGLFAVPFGGCIVTFEQGLAALTITVVHGGLALFRG